MIDPMNHNACLTSSLMEIFSYLSLNPRLGFPFRDTADDLEFSRIERDNKVPRFKFHDSFECSRIAFGLLGRLLIEASGFLLGLNYIGHRWGMSKRSCSKRVPLLSEAEVSEASLIPLKHVLERLGISRTTAYRLMKSGELRTIRVGAKRMVTRSELVRILNEGTRPEEPS